MIIVLGLSTRGHRIISPHTWISSLETSTGCRLTLRDVRHVPDVRVNLISAGKFDDDGYASHFGEGRWKLAKGSLVVARGKKENGCFVMQAKLCEKGIDVPSLSCPRCRIRSLIRADLTEEKKNYCVKPLEKRKSHSKNSRL